jgi:cupin fold WbuC family metalloprotein
MPVQIEARKHSNTIGAEHYRLHAELSDPINRFINAGLVGTYVRPHCHRIGRWELVNVLQGSLDVVIFTSGGQFKVVSRSTQRVRALLRFPVESGTLSFFTHPRRSFWK